MFNILTYVRVAPATANVHIILEVPATDKIHIEDRYCLAEPSQTMGYKTRKTVNWFARKQLHFLKLCGARRDKKGNKPIHRTRET